MDIFEWLLNNGTVLDGTVICRFIMLTLILNFFGIVTYWLPRMK